MGREQRCHGRRYDCAGERVGGRVVKHDLGTGPAVARKVAAHAAHAAAATELRELRASLRSADALADGLDTLGHLAAEAVVRAAGCQHAGRKPWRHRRARLA